MTFTLTSTIAAEPTARCVTAADGPRSAFGGCSGGPQIATEASNDGPAVG